MRSLLLVVAALALALPAAIATTDGSELTLDSSQDLGLGRLRVHPACPSRAKYEVGLCTRLVSTLAGAEGTLSLVLDNGEVVCGIQRFAYDDIRECSKVHDHMAHVAQVWDLQERRRGQTPEEFCIHVLAEPVHSLALLSPRTERKCLGTKTAEDDKFDMEPAAPEGYTGNILEDPFNTDIYYLNGCLCSCANKKPGAPCKSCDCSKKGGGGGKVDPFVPPAPKPKHPKPQPPHAPAKPVVCKKGDFPYAFPYTTYLKEKKNDVHVVADFNLQRMRVYKGTKVLKEYVMSSSEVGIGSAPGSLRSPSGMFRIAEKVGGSAKKGADFVGLRENGKFSKEDDQSAIQSRVLVLDGEDSDNKNTKARQIYIHGTNKKRTLGQPASQGCFRLSNKDVIDLYKRVKVGTKVFAIPKCAWPKSAKPKVKPGKKGGKKGKKRGRKGGKKGRKGGKKGGRKGKGKKGPKKPCKSDRCRKRRAEKQALKDAIKKEKDPKKKQSLLQKLKAKVKAWVKEKAAKLKGKLKAKTQQVKDKIKSKLADIKNKLKTKTGEVKEKLKKKAAELKDKLKGKLATLFGKKPTPAVVPPPKTPTTPLPKKPQGTCLGHIMPKWPYDQGLHVVIEYGLQKMRLYQGATLVKEYTISSGLKGVGNAIGSEKSPYGRFRIAGKIGEGAALGADFVGLKLTGKKSTMQEKSAIQTRVLTLEGLDAANKNTMKREVLIHGTNRVQELGKPASRGCIRLSNQDAIDFFNRVQVGTRVTAQATCAWPR